MGGRHPHTTWPEGMARKLTIPERSIDANMEETAKANPDGGAIIFQGRHFSFGDIWSKVQSLAGFLQADLGLTKGDRVLLFMQNSPQFIISYYGILRAGGVVVPVNPMNQKGELRYLVDNTGASIMVAGLELTPNAVPLLEEGALQHIIGAAYADMGDPSFDIPLPAPLPDLTDTVFTGPGCYRFSDAVASGSTPRPRETGPDDRAVIPFSSGTTGHPKGCVHSHRTVMTTTMATSTWTPTTPENITLATLPFFHVTGMQSSMNVPILRGSPIVILTRWNAVHAAKLIERYKVTHWASIATMAIDLLNNAEAESYDLSSLETIGGGGAAMPDAIAVKLRNRVGRPYLEGYGLSETMAALHINPPDAPRDQCLGVPIFDVDSRIVAPGTTDELDLGEPGEIVTHAPQVFLGYWNNEEATRDAFVEIDGKPFFRTGDIAYRDADGYFYMVDRVKRMVNVSGFKVWPAEVEAMMLHHPGIAEACVVGAKDDRRGEFVKAHVVRRNGANGGLSEQDIIDWCRHEMAAYKCPRQVVFADALPKSATGKVLWKDLS
ncbi:long-chain-fatty-acid--CoA ligase [Shimia biformata]|uniref:long-chain-fatty-acid--CoA ligase n=1 Tax=Shimia biformata TaxID=1294299 RepID=UPI0019517D39|nr:long-chain-fatty-acid--CoA ligase [Shimia biformata]